MAIRVGARNDSLAMIRRALPVNPPSGPPKLAWTSTVWPAIGCPVWPGWIGPKHAISITASDDVPLAKPTNIWFGPIGTGSWMGLPNTAPGADPRAPALTATAPSIKRRNMAVLLNLIFERAARQTMGSRIASTPRARSEITQDSTPPSDLSRCLPAAQSPKGDRQSGCCAIRRGSAIGSSHAARAAKDAGERPRVDLASPDARHATRVFSRTA